MQPAPECKSWEYNGVATASSDCPLTNRETEVLRLMGEGLTTKAIAGRLNITFKTAACHRSRVLQKLGAPSSVSAVLWAAGGAVRAQGSDQNRSQRPVFREP